MSSTGLGCHALLTDGIDAPVTLVAATAGWGKTLLAASWLATDAADRVTAWVTLEPIDDSPQIFWRAVARALTPRWGRSRGGTAQVTAVTSTKRICPAPSPPHSATSRGRWCSCWTTCTRSFRQRCTRGCSGSSHTRRRRCCCSSQRVATRRGRWLSSAWRDWWPRCGGDLAFRPDEAAALFAQLVVEVDPRSSTGSSTAPKGGRPGCDWSPCT